MCLQGQLFACLLAIAHVYPKPDSTQQHLTSSLYKIIFIRLKKRKYFSYNKRSQNNIENRIKQKVSFNKSSNKTTIPHKTPINRNYLHIFILSRTTRNISALKETLNRYRLLVSKIRRNIPVRDDFAQ